MLKQINVIAGIKEPVRAYGCSANDFCYYCDTKDYCAACDTLDGCFNSDT
ncbi:MULTISPECIES: freyrasin family ranthipeptide [Paenibacillus]|nr:MULTISPECIES: freyrasin family ranthipeptide [Paenibacillus]